MGQGLSRVSSTGLRLPFPVSIPIVWYAGYSLFNQSTGIDIFRHSRFASCNRSFPSRLGLASLATSTISTLTLPTTFTRSSTSTAESMAQINLSPQILLASVTPLLLSSESASSFILDMWRLTVCYNQLQHLQADTRLDPVQHTTGPVNWSLWISRAGHQLCWNRLGLGQGVHIWLLSETTADDASFS